MLVYIICHLALNCSLVECEAPGKADNGGEEGKNLDEIIELKILQ